MPDDQSEKIIKLLEEIRDLTRDRNGKFEEYIKIYRERSAQYDEALKIREAAQERARGQRRLFRWTTIPVLLLGVGFLAYLALWVIPRSDEKDYNEQMQQDRMILEQSQLFRTNLQAMPH